MRPALPLALALAACASRTPSPVSVAPWPRPDASADAPALDAATVDVVTATDAAPTPVALRGVTRLVFLSDTTCAVTDAGRIACWQGGEATWAAPGPIPENAGRPDGAYLVPGLTEVTAACIDLDTLCALRRDGSVVCRSAPRWDPETGTEQFEGVIVESTLATGRDVLDLQSDRGGCAIVRRDGRVDRIAIPARPDEAVTLRAAALPPPSAVRCALTDGRARCVGENPAGLLANASTRAFTEAAPSDLFALTGLRQVALGARHGCAATADGAVRCWGRNIEGQLGTGDRRRRAVPTVVPGVDRAVSVAVGAHFSCAARDDGEVRCWGLGRDGQLGDGASVDRLTPAVVPGVRDAVELQAGERGVCARTREGAVWCWGAYASRESPTPWAVSLAP